MDAKHYPDLATADAVVHFANQLLAEINLGVLIYQLEDRQHEGSLKLLYANEEASHHTGTDLRTRIGKYILEAFPSLQETELPKVYSDVVRSGKACKVGAVEYADQSLRPGRYSVKAFPMPADCVAVIFEDIALQKQVDELVKKQTAALQDEKNELVKTLESVKSELLELQKSGLSKNVAASVARILKMLAHRP